MNKDLLQKIQEMKFAKCSKEDHQHQPMSKICVFSDCPYRFDVICPECNLENAYNASHNHDRSPQNFILINKYLRKLADPELTLPSDEYS